MPPVKRGHGPSPSQDLPRWHSRRQSSNIPTLEAGLSEASARQIQQLENEVTRSRQDVQVLHERNVHLEFENLSLREDVDAVQTMLQDAEMAKAELEQQVKEYSAQLKQMAEERGRLQFQVDSERSENNQQQKSLAKMIDVLQEELMQAQTDMEANKKRKSAKSPLTPQGPCSACRLYRQDLQTAYETQHQLEVELASQRQAVEQLQDTLQLTQADLEVAREGLEVANEDQEQLAKLIRMGMSKLPSTFQRDSSLSTNAVTNMTHLVKCISSITKSMVDLDNENTLMKMNLEGKTTKMTKMQEFIDFLKREKPSITRVWKMQTDIKGLQDLIDDKEKTIRDLRRQIKPWREGMLGWLPQQPPKPQPPAKPMVPKNGTRKKVQQQRFQTCF